MSDESRTFHHRPVMSERVGRLFEPVPEGTVVDATVGGGGHARSVLVHNPRVRVLGLDRDPTALDAARVALEPFGERAVLCRTRFDALAEVVATEAAHPVTGVLFDLGVSSPQFDRPERGFSYRHDGPLDMRMDPETPIDAAWWVNDADEADLRSVLVRNADERYARRIAAAIVARRPVHTTTELAEIVKEAIPAPARRRGGHPAKRTFQAIRIEVNGELEVLPRALDQALDILVPGGRLAVLTYHSGEDRLVKRRLDLAATGGCTCPAGLPCGCGAVSTVRLLRRGGWTADAAEVTENPRAASARLRAAERLEAA
ncbi:MAG: 16S rRNA (cytosine(1402)-N(4))-methyltransferase RsmH [Acidimicrobiia bacterium]|nr:16S rRNA (cytosine(1402)-N(4))-methyltransferase RsmH [Acidimicrobiia bacterium]